MIDALDEKMIACPYCGETITVLVDLSAGSQRYTEDCSVCCRPMVIAVEIEDDAVSVIAGREDD